VQSAIVKYLSCDSSLSNSYLAPQHSMLYNTTSSTCSLLIRTLYTLSILLLHAMHCAHRIVEVQAKQFIVIVDASKMADGIGPHFDLPVEIIKFCSEHVRCVYIYSTTAANIWYYTADMFNVVSASSCTHISCEM
jgi:Ribose 5-phosphate isomerase A (phosphoriboisomerase A)